MAGSASDSMEPKGEPSEADCGLQVGGLAEAPGPQDAWAS